jgi:hypothetical protein
LNYFLYFNNEQQLINSFISIEKIYEPISFIKYRSICVDEKNVTNSILIETRGGPFSKFMIQIDTASVKLIHDYENIILYLFLTHRNRYIISL